MAKKFIKPTHKVVEQKPEIKPEPKPELELGVIGGEENIIKNGVVETESLTKPATTPEFDLNRYKVSHEGGLFLRENPPSDTNSNIGYGPQICCMNYGDVFVEIKRVNNWSYGNHNGKSGWTCNLYLEKEE